MSTLNGCGILCSQFKPWILSSRPLPSFTCSSCWSLEGQNVTLILLCLGLLGSYVVDAADRDNIAISKNELHDLLNKPSLHGIPLLVLGNKIDKPEAISKQALIDQM
jgi:hypothetical protein